MSTITTPSSSSSLPTIVILPRITIQPTFLDVLNDIKQGLHAVEDTWCSIYKENEKSIHGRIRINEVDQEGSSGNEGKVEFTGRDGVIIRQLSNTSFTISSSKSASLIIPPTTISFPSSIPYSLRLGIDAFDISPANLDTKDFLVGGKDGIVRIGEMKTGGKVKDLRGHVGDIRDVKFFPSGGVALTAGIDMSLRIFSLLDTTNIRTLLGHTGTITSTHIHSKGKTVLSSSMDGTIRIWNVGKEEILKVIRFSLPITTMIIGSVPVVEGEKGEKMEVEEEQTEEEESIEGKLAILGHSNGSASLYIFTSIEDSTSIPIIRTLRTGISSAIEAIAYDETIGLILLGSRNGTISVFNLNKFGEGEEELLPIGRFRRSDSAITSISFTSSLSSSTSSILVGSGDGLPYKLSLSLNSSSNEGIEVKVLEEFAGMDCDSVIIKNGNIKGEIWVGGQDGGLRKYLSST